MDAQISEYIKKSLNYTFKMGEQHVWYANLKAITKYN